MPLEPILLFLLPIFLFSEKDGAEARSSHVADVLFLTNLGSSTKIAFTGIHLWRNTNLSYRISLKENQRFWQHCWKTIFPNVLRYIQHNGGDKAAAEDVFLNSFIHLYEIEKDALHQSFENYFIVMPKSVAKEMSNGMDWN